MAPGLAIWPRAAWGGDLLPKGELLPEDVRFLLVHHSATTNTYTQASIPATLRNVYAFHTGPAKGWPDICYNFFVDRYGGVWEARTGSLDGPVMASATGGSQGFAQLVCLLGDFTNELPTPAAIERAHHAPGLAGRPVRARHQPGRHHQLRQPGLAAMGARRAGDDQPPSPATGT